MEIRKLWLSKCFVCIFVFGSFIFFSILHLKPHYILRHYIVVRNETFTREKDYLVLTSKCMIRNVDPWNDEIKPFYKKEPYVFCAKHDLLTYVVKNDTSAILYVNQKAAKQYNVKSLRCCYSNVSRSAKANIPDDDIIISKCNSFHDQLDITDKIVTVKCWSKAKFYSNTHVPVTINQRIQTKMETYNSTKPKTARPLSVLFVGIDSISRLNFIRTMPRTREFLIYTDWIEYTGYNKIADNTFPNVMAILTGKNPSSVYDVCNPFILGKLDNCSFIWKDYSGRGYVTAYAEDESNINTFNHKMKGFIADPVDYYFRPYTFAFNKLNKKRIDELYYCTGPEVSGERILNLAKDFSTTFKTHPFFGFFWMNSFSHNKVNSPTRLDAKVLQFFKDLQESGVFENALVIFLSDHGLRFGKVRQTRTGSLEERLPFLYFSIPKWFQNKYPREYYNLRVNANNQLTTPYDLYMTLQDNLKLSGFNYTILPSDGCTLCKSLFQDIKPRSCEEVGIDIHWCTCYDYKPASDDDKLIKEAAKFVLDQINLKVSSYGKESKKCAKYSVSKVISANTSVRSFNTNETYILIILETTPEAVFETTISVINGNFTRGSYISRLDEYYPHSRCVKNPDDNFYCYCKRNKMVYRFNGKAVLKYKIKNRLMKVQKKRGKRQRQKI